ncbi:MAG: hypothetical protein JNM65_09635 [Verrucomicrobiaceae bacterium]|nr:hypothetical protein [Verrucomicrobiaceae bacterium]
MNFTLSATLLSFIVLVATTVQAAPPFILRQGTEGEVVPQVTAPSLVPNADFTEGLKGWTKSADQGVSATAEAARANDARCKDEPVLRVRSRPLSNRKPTSAFIRRNFYPSGPSATAVPPMTSFARRPCGSPNPHCSRRARAWSTSSPPSAKSTRTPLRWQRHDQE